MWAVTLGRFDIAAPIITTSWFRQAPRVGHLKRVQRSFGYLMNLPNGSIRYRTHEPDFSNLPHKQCDCERTVYSGAKEVIADDIPEPKGRYVVTTHYVDAKSAS